MKKKMFQTIVRMFNISCRDGLVQIWKKIAITFSMCGTVILSNEGLNQSYVCIC